MDNEHDRWLANEIASSENEHVLAAGQMVTYIERLQLLVHEPLSERRQCDIAKLAVDFRTTIRSVGQTFRFDDVGPVVDVPGTYRLTQYGGFRDGFRYAVEAFRVFMADRMRGDGTTFDQSGNTMYQFRLAIKSLKSFLIIDEALTSGVSYQQAAYQLQVRRDEEIVNCRCRPEERVDVPVAGFLEDTASTISTSEHPPNLSANDRMMAKFGSDPCSVSWTATEWGAHLKVSPAAVKQTNAWKNLMTVRAMQVADKASR